MSTFLIRTAQLLSGLLAATALIAQPQLDNPSYEAWTNVGQASQEPAEWSSLKTSDGGAFINALVPQLCWRSTDAHTGSYSVNLRTVSSVAGDANGLLTNGRVHAELAVENSYMFTVQDDAQWNTTMTSRPDSIVGWFKADPETGDRPNVGALLHVDDGRLPAFGTEGNYVAGASWKGPYAQVTEWTRFSAPFQYLNNAQPEWILLILTAGDSAGSSVGTQVWYDDLALIYNLYCTPQVPLATVSATEPFALAVDYNTGGIPVAATEFAVELSDPSGSFSAPTTIGTLTSSSSFGTIPCSIPAGTSPAAGYKLRVVAPSPFYASVPTDFIIEGATGLVDREGDRWNAWPVPTGLVVDLRSVPFNDPHFQLFDARGGLLQAGRLQPGSLNTIALDGGEGLFPLRVMHLEGEMVRKLLLR